MSSAIPFHFLITSYPNEKLIQAEKDYYQKLEDFSKVFCDQLQNDELSNYDYPFYREYLDVCAHEHSAVTDVMYKRGIEIPKRVISQHIINVFELSRVKGFKWERRV